MAKMALNKSSLLKESRRLQSFEQFLPALDLKRKQIIGERYKVRNRLQAFRDQAANIRQRVENQLPMMADADIRLDGLVRITRTQLGEENLVGIHLPVLKSVQIEVTPYSFFSRPHWVDALVDAMKGVVELKLQIQIQAQRLSLLEEALRKTTQRINLFEKVLVPQTQENIRKIKIFLSDGERAGVVRAKIAKNKKSTLH
jgi:V/A-type H+-transporting ATPase subunit D